MRKNEMPEFGLLSGLKVVHASSVVAGPIAAELMAENGADVIWIESKRALDTNRGKGGMGAESERRNMRNISSTSPPTRARRYCARCWRMQTCSSNPRRAASTPAGD